MKNLRYYSRTLTKEKNMQVKIQELAGEFVDDELHSDLVTIMKENSKHVDEVHPEGTFSNLFWKERLLL